MRKGFHEPTEKPRRFYKAVTVAQADGGYAVLLDGRTLSGPKGTKLVLPTRALADQVAEEWAAQGETIEFGGMHATRLANTALEAVGPARAAIADQIADYAGSDLLCYLATEPQGLIQRQTERWGPVLDRAEAAEGLRLSRVAGVVHQAQPADTLIRVRDTALALDDYGMAGLAFGASLFGSAILAIAVLRGWLGGVEAFELSRLDEAWTEEKWGVDAEAAQRTERLRGEAAMLQRWFAGLPPAT
ncbi:ATP12 family chaperone protein [Phenylobacterium sp.]|uniref:ATP12 family chaperone protein n=1 Tax=Phenylobacterium sp. TaxID=1871053 RepID=UPI003983282A